MADSPPPPFFAAGTAANLSRPADCATHPAGVVVEIVGTLMGNRGRSCEEHPKNQEGGGVLALGGQRFVNRHNNQPKVGGKR